MDVVDSLLMNESNLTPPCKLGIENETLFCLDQPHPSKEWQPAVQILLYSLIFLLSVLGNTLVITVLIRNKRMRTVTNIFLLSLAVSDLMLCLFCMPFNLIPNLLKDFIFGSAVCKTTTYFMGTSVSVSTFNLVAISLERYGAICKPLQSRVWQTKSHALKVIAATWCLSFTIMTPYPIYSNLVPFTKNNNQTANMCRFLLPSDVMQQSWHTFLLLILFLIPGIVMMVAYGLISLELYQGIKFDASQKKSARERKRSSANSGRYADSAGCCLQRPKHPRQLELRQLSSGSAGRADRIRSSSPAASLMAKKRVIRMLMVIVVLFFLCWMPIFSANAWRAFDTASAERRLSGTPIAFILLLSYTSSCVNPIIYCFMNKRFRLGFLATFPCCPNPGPPGARGEVGDEVESGTTRASLSKCSYSHGSASAPPP
ncbi:cholecystokinin receptor type A isoform X2 [Bubalus bubalis]|uniref:cholecystokinin receptor type A isoform X2 n=1 Tax=Bubalus bubalis TaxID=89462 RepID=UPI001D0FD0A1|nr:cholecystokinin receptor type A isoform X2 [Bubalus bubalis]